MNPETISDVLSPWIPGVFSLVMFIVAVMALMGLMMFLTAWLGEKKKNPEKQRPYESGIIPTGSARLHYPIHFSLVAIFFLIFDVEGIFIFSWAISCRQLGWMGYLQIIFFILVLLIGLVYIWRKGGLAWHEKTTIE